MYFIECSPKTGDYTLALSNESNKKNYLLHKYEPKEQVLKVLEDINWGNKNTIWILFGFQFGYLIDKLIEEVGETVNILVIEPDPAILEEELELCGHYYNKKKNISFFSGNDWMQFNEILDEVIGMENFNNYKMISNKEYLVYYKDYYKKVIELVKLAAMNKKINYHTIILGNTQNIVNAVRNRYDYVKTCDMMLLDSKFKDIPAVLVLAGPSLDKNIKYLKEFNGLIFIVGRTITPVLKLGVTPDLVFALDPYDFTIKTFGDYQKYDVPLFALGQCCASVVQGCQSPYKYFLYNTNEIRGLLGIKINPVLSLSGSVATLCLSTATFLGCSPILFIGQDLAYEGNKKYANEADELYKPEMMKKDIGLKKIKGYYGDEVYSNATMINFRRWIENFIYQNSSTKYINCTEGGAYIEGAEHISFKEAIKRYNPPKKVTIQHQFLKENEGIDIDKNLVQGIKNMQIIEKYVHQSINDFDTLIQIYQNEKSTKKRDKEVLKYVSQIEKRDKEIKKLERSEPLMNMLMERAKYAIMASNDCKEPLHETQEEYRLRYIRVNRETYIYIEKECIKLLDLLIKELPQELQNEVFKKGEQINEL